MTAEKIVFSAKKRTVMGKKSKQLHASGLIAGNIVVPGEQSLPISVHGLEFEKLYESAGESSLIYLNVDGEKSERPVLIDEVSYNPLLPNATHVVFKQVNLKEEIEADVPIEVVGEFKVPGAVLLTVKDFVEVRALPADLPESIVIVADNLTEIGQTVSLADLDYDHDKVELVLAEGVLAEEIPVVIVQEEKVEAEPEEEEAVAEDEASPATTPTEAAKTE